MKYLHIVEASATGTLSMVSLLANKQVIKGHRVSVIYSMRPESPQNLKDLFLKDVELINVQMYSSFEKICSVLVLRNALRQMRPDKIFMHSSFAGFLGRLSSAFILNNTRLFYIPHCISFMRRDIGFFKRASFIALELFAAFRKASYVACSKSEQLAIRKFIPFRKCHLVENALDFESASTVEEEGLSSTEERVVITVGQIRPQKGPCQFAEISTLMKEVDSTIKFVWVGDGDEELRNTLEAAGVNVTGWCLKSDVWRLLKGSSVYVSTSLWEGLPVSVIEASFFGVPVVASSCAGNVDVIEHGKTGWIFDTPSEAVGLIAEVFRNEMDSMAVKKRASEVTKARFSSDRYIEEMESL